MVHRLLHARSIAKAMKKTGRGESRPISSTLRRSRHRYTEATIPHIPRELGISDSLRVTVWNGRLSSKGGPGWYGNRPPLEGEKKEGLHRNKQTRVPWTRRALPHPIPLGHRFRDDMAPCPNGAGDPQGSGLSLACPCLAYPAHPAHPVDADCPSVAPMLTAQGGFVLLRVFVAAALLASAPVSLSLSTPDHETSGPLLAPAQTWLSSFCDLRGGTCRGDEGGVEWEERGEWGGVVFAKRAIRHNGRLEASGPFRDCAFGDGFLRGGPGDMQQFEN